MLSFRILAALSLAAFLSFQSSCGGDDADTGSDPSTTTDPSDVSDSTDATDATDQTDASDPSTTDDPSDVSATDDPSSPESTDDPSDPSDPSDVGDVIQCDDAPVFQPSDTCSVLTTEGATNLIFGTVLAEGKVYERGAVVFDAQGTITCVGCGCRDEGQAVIDCGEHIVSPGLINAHDHIGWIHQPPAQWGEERFEHRHDWRKGKRGHSRISSGSSGGADQKAWGELRQLMTGTTSIMASGNAAGMLRNLDSVTYQEGLGQPAVDAPTFPLGDSSGVYVTEDCSYPSLPSESAVLSEDAWIPHVGEGIDDEARNEFLCLAFEARGGVDVTESNGAYIHAIGLKAIDAVELAVGSTSVVWSPRSNISLYGNTAQVTLLDTVGVRLAMGTDWTPSGSASMLRELACASYLNETHFANYFTDKDLWLMATQYGAEVAAVDDALGSLRPGLVADISVFKNRGGSAYNDVISASTQDVIAVMRGGKWLYGEADALGSWDSSCSDTRDICGRSMRFCLAGEISGTLTQLEAANVDSYGLFFCDTPEGEPTCLPSRENEYNGVTATDADGDGVEDAQDNCPSVFNPIRPVDGGVQADHDSDGAGDVCDPCPLDAETETCSAPDPDDRDGDGFLNDEDNCPSISNPSQDDFDNDGKGDACDPCVQDPNPGTALCPLSIFEIKDGTVEDGTRGQIGGVVTAVSTRGFWIQEPAMASTEYLGIYVYAGTGVTLPAEGHEVSVGGSVGDYYGQIQLSNITEIVDLGLSPLPIEPVEVLPSAVRTGGEDADKYEGMLVRVSGIVESLNPPAGDGTGDSDPTNAFVIDGLRIDDYLYDRSSLPEIGTPLVVTGILRYGNQHSKLEPRRAEDIVIDQSADAVLLAPAVTEVFAEVSAGFTSTYPASLLSLSRAAGVDGLSVELTSSSELLEVASPLSFAEGVQEQEVLVKALAAGIAAEVTLTEGTRSYVVQVNTLDPQREPTPQLGVSSLSAALNQTIELEVTLSEPAPAGGTTVALSAANGLVSVASAELEFAAWQQSASVSVTVGSEAGNETLTFTSNGGSAELSIEILSVVPTLFISEYSEGSSNNKYIEIFNPTSGQIALDDYRFSMCNNGCDAEGSFDYPNNTFDTGAVIAAGDVYVMCHPSSSSTISAECDETYGYLSNGDDTFALVTTTGEMVDMVGTMSTTDVGDGWTVAGVANATKDHTLVRKGSIQRGEPDWAASAGTNEVDSQWIVLSKDEWGYLGSHPHPDL